MNKTKEQENQRHGNKEQTDSDRGWEGIVRKEREGSSQGTCMTGV